MAEQKKPSKGKKFMVGLGVLAVIAIIVVVIVISIPPNTSSALQLLNKAYTQSFLMNQSEKTAYNTFETKVANCQKINNYVRTMPTEMADVETLSIALAEVLDYYNDYLTFAQSNKNFHKNYKSIKNGLNGAINSQKKLNSILEEANSLGDQSSTYLQNAWIDFRIEYTEWLGDYYKAISSLNKAYQGSMGDVTTNNLASTTILNATTNFIEVIYNDFATLVKYDAENPNATSYTYASAGKILAFADFVDYNLDNDTEIKNYYFSTTIKEKYQKIEQFFTLYGEEDMKNLISSIKLISNNAVVTKTYDGVQDSEGVYTAVYTFLVGGV